MGGKTKAIAGEMPVFNMLRWTSAFLVLAGHAIGWTFDLDPAHLAGRPALRGLQYVLDLGPGAVIVFFVVSGYLVGGGVLERMDAFSWRRHAVARFSRIYVVVVPALLLTASLDGLAGLIAPHNPIYAAPWGRIATPVFAAYGWSNVLASVFSLESIIGNPMGSDGALWSLGFEWAFYFLLPAIVGVSRRFVGSRSATLVACAAAALPLGALHPTWALFWLVWLSGAAARSIRVPAWAGAVGAAMGIAGLLALPLVNQKMASAVEGLGFALFLAWPASRTFRIAPSLDHRLAGLSYSLYLVHMPLLTFAAFLMWRSGLMPLERFQPGPTGALCYVALCAISLGCAWIFSALFEKQTDRVRAWLSRVLPDRAEPVAAPAVARRAGSRG